MGGSAGATRRPRARSAAAGRRAVHPVRDRLHGDLARAVDLPAGRQRELLRPADRARLRGPLLRHAPSLPLGRRRAPAPAGPGGGCRRRRRLRRRPGRRARSDPLRPHRGPRRARPAVRDDGPSELSLRVSRHDAATRRPRPRARATPAPARGRRRLRAHRRPERCRHRGDGLARRLARGGRDRGDPRGRCAHGRRAPRGRRHRRRRGRRRRRARAADARASRRQRGAKRARPARGRFRRVERAPAHLGGRLEPLPRSPGARHRPGHLPDRVRRQAHRRLLGHRVEREPDARPQRGAEPAGHPGTRGCPGRRGLHRGPAARREARADRGG